MRVANQHFIVCVAILVHCVLSVPIDKKEDKSLITGRASVLGRFEPIVNSVVVPFLVATGVVSLVRMVPGVVSSLPGMLGFAKRTGYEGVGGASGEQVPKEFYDIMNMLDNAAIRYGQPADPAAVQRQQVASHQAAYPYHAYQAYLQQVQAQQAAAVQRMQAAQQQAAQSAQTAQATARHSRG